jgi:hypothetical protein
MERLWIIVVVEGVMMRQASSLRARVGRTTPQNSAAGRGFNPTLPPLSKDLLTIARVKGLRRVPRHLDEDARYVAHTLGRMPAFELSCRNRKKIEMLFVHLTRIPPLGRLRLRGPSERGGTSSCRQRRLRS